MKKCLQTRLIVLVISASTNIALATTTPSWFEKDSEDSARWTLNCQATAKTETEAEESAGQACLRKICELFGLEVESKTVVSETLQDTQVQRVLTETCQKIRVLGKKTTNKQTSCDDNECANWIQITYSKKEFDIEKARLKDLEQSSKKINYKSVSSCQSDLNKFAKIGGWNKSSIKDRMNALESAVQHCTDLSPEDSVSMFIPLSDYSQWPQGATFLIAQHLKDQLKLIDRIKGTLSFLKRQEAFLGLSANLKKEVLGRWDSFFPGAASYDYASQKFRTRQGALVSENPYLSELKTCKAISSLMILWPGDFGEDITVCLPKEKDQALKECQMVNTLLLRGRLASCLCHARVPSGIEGRCTQVLLQHINNLCPREMTKECRDLAAKGVAEALSQAFSID